MKNALAVVKNKYTLSMDSEHLMGVVTAHGLEQILADVPAVIGRIDEKPADMLGRTHGQYARDHPKICVNLRCGVE